MGGVACIPYDTLSSFMQQEEISMNIAISNYWHDIMGMSPAAKARELFNLMYEKMCRPELCYEDFDEIRKGEMERFGKESVLEQMMKRASDRMLTNLPGFSNGKYGTSSGSNKNWIWKDWIWIRLQIIIVHYTAIRRK